MRKIDVTGFIGSDAKKQVSRNGNEYITFSIGSNEFGDEKDANGRTKTYWFNVMTFNQRHLNLAQYLKKGKPIIVSGDYSDNIYQNKMGACEISRNIIANAIYFVNTGTQDLQGQGTPQQGQMTHANTTAYPSSAPTIQTSMVKQPTTAEIMDKQQTVAAQTLSDDLDDLPF